MDPAASPLTLVGSRVRTLHGTSGIVTEYAPLNSGMCDVVLREDTGRLCAYASADCRFLDGSPLPDRRALIESDRAETVACLERIRAKHIREWHKPWLGMEAGKALVGRMIDGAIRDLKG